VSARNSISSVGHDEAPFRTRAGLPDRIGSSQSFVAKSAKADQQARCIFAQPCRKSPARGEAFCSRRQGCRLGHFTAPVGSMDRGRPSWVSTVDTLPLSPSARACSFSATSVVGNRSAYGHRTGYFRGRSHHERARCRRGAERGFGHHGGRQWCRALFGPVFSCNLPVPIRSGLKPDYGWEGYAPHATARVHHAPQRGGRLATRGAGAAGRAYAARWAAVAL
jgi:hypothetical protein